MNGFHQLSKGCGTGLESTLLQIEDRYVSFFGLDRSSTVSRVRELHAMGFSTDEFEGLPERWHLQNLCVRRCPSAFGAPFTVATSVSPLRPPHVHALLVTCLCYAATGGPGASTAWSWCKTGILGS